MKPTIKVSIGGRAFSMEDEAYLLLNDYLKDLQTHFQENPEAKEIVSDIECRLSELLEMRLDNNESIISVQNAKEIIGIMGNPKDFDDDIQDKQKQEEEVPENNQSEAENHLNDLFKKKFYRDTKNGIVGGVLSGIAHYFKIDPTILRVVFVGLLVLLNFASFNAAGMLVLAYGLLWIIMPKAVTLAQRLSMTGTNPSIEDIENRSDISAKTSYKGSIINDILKIGLKMILIVFIVSLSIAIAAVILGLIWVHFDTEILGANNYFDILGLDAVYFKAALFVFLAMPLLGLLGLFVKILNKSSFTMRTLVIFVIGLIFWFGAVFYLTNQGVRYILNMNDRTDKSEMTMLEANSNTLYVTLSDECLSAKQQPLNPYLYYFDEKDGKQLFILPRIHVKTDTLAKNYGMEIKKTAFDKDRSSMQRKLENEQLSYNTTDSMLIIQPKWYDKNNPWDGMLYDVYITVPANKNIVVKSPLNE